MENGSYLRIRDLPSEERPRERLIRLGAAALSNAELLAIMLRTGTKGHSAIDLAHRLLKQFGDLPAVARASLDDMCEIGGIGETKAAQVQAALELGRRLSRAPDSERPRFSCSRDVVRHVGEALALCDREEFRILLLNTKNRLLREETVSRGTVDASLVHPREVFKSAVKAGCTAVIIVHNHPSGDPTPSSEDREVTRRLREAGRVVGIDLLDHVIVGAVGDSGQRRYFSFKDEELL